MLKYIGKRILYLVPIVAGVIFVVFTLLYFAPGDPAMIALGDTASEEDITAYREELGINGTYIERLARYYKEILKGNLGISYKSRNPVVEELGYRFQRTFILATISLIIGAVLGIVFGIIAAVRQYSVFDWLSTVFSLIGISTPTFASGLLLIVVFSVELGWFPASGWDLDSHMVLPIACLGFASIGMIMRATRSSMLDVLKQDYIVTAKAKGQGNLNIIFKHALRNAAIPILTIVSLQYVNLLSGSYLAESVFAIAGCGHYMVNSLSSRNYSSVLGSVILLAVLAATVNLATDIMYTFLNPRLKVEQKNAISRTKKTSPKEVG